MKKMIILYKIGYIYSEKEAKHQFEDAIKKTSFEMDGLLSDSSSNKSN